MKKVNFVEGLWALLLQISGSSFKKSKVCEHKKTYSQKYDGLKKPKFGSRHGLSPPFSLSIPKTVAAEC